MAFSRLLVLFCCFIFAKSEPTRNVAENQDPFPQVNAVLDYLNSNSNGVYEYKSGTLASAQNKANIIEVTVEVYVNCLKTYPEIPCNEGVLVCHAFIGQSPDDQTYQVLSDVKCIPKIEIIVEDMDEVKYVAPMAFAEQSREVGKIDLSSEALSPAQGGADFVAVHRDHVPCLGCPFDLNTDAEGIEELINTAVKHIESERIQRHKITNVRRLQQQVVAGVKYILLAEVAQTKCPKDADLSAPCILDTSVEPFICEVIFIEKPWISKSKHVIKNNCTVSQEFEPVNISKREQDDINNEILPHGGFNNPTPQDNPKPVPNYDAMAETGNMEEDMDAARLADLESQIIFGDMFESPKLSKVDEGPRNFMPSTFGQPKPISVEPTPMFTEIEDTLKVEPLNIEQGQLYRVPLFPLVAPIVDESEPVVTMYTYQNEEPIKTSDENTVSKDTENFESENFESYLPVQERLKRELKEDSDSDSNSDSSSEEKGRKEKIEVKAKVNEIDATTVAVVKREKADASEESFESDGSSEGKLRVRRATTSEENSVSSHSTEEQNDEKRPKRATDNNNDSSSSSSSCSDDDEHNNDDNKEIVQKAKLQQSKKTNNNNNDKDSSSSSSSSSDSDDNDHNNNDNNEIVQKKKIQRSEKANNNNNDKDSSSSSSSSSSDEDEEKQRPRRSIGQMQKISSDEKVIVRDLADFAAATLDNEDDDNHKRVILQILGAKKLKLDGIYYQIILRLGISHCHEHEHNESCREKLFTNLTKICKVQVHVEDDYSNPKVVKSQCQNIKKDENDRNKTNYSRYRRAVLLGGHTPMSTDNPTVKKFVSATLEHLDSESDHPNRHKAVDVYSATSQVVAGMSYVITVGIGLSDCAKSEQKSLETCGLLKDSKPETCTIDVWDRSWLKKTIYRVNCTDKVYNFGDVEDNTRKKRQALVGAPGKIPKDSDEVLNHLERGLVYMDSKSKHENKYVVDEVLSASRQVVAGTLTRIRASVALSDCVKGSESKNCTKLNDAQNEQTVCKFKIWEKPWLNFTQTNITCENKQKHSFRSKRSIDGWNQPQLLGADETLSTEHIEAKNYIKMALEFISLKSETEGKYQLKNINKVSRRIVAGSLWNIEADIALCTEIQLTRSSFYMCPDEDQHIRCRFMVLNQPWHANGLTINVTCDNDDQVYTYVPANGLTEDTMSSFDYEGAFRRFIREHNKVYEVDEYNYRLKVFRDNANKIALLNKYDKGTAQYGFTRFADLTEKEFSQRHGYRPDLQNENELPFAQAKIPNIELPTEFDWRTKGAVTHVKNQGLCGSCWAFSVTGNVEGQYAIKHGKLLEFSEQELVDCDKVDDGCNGGLMDNAYRVIEKLGGLETESDYPYEGDDEKCTFNVGKVKVELTGAVNISHNETDMAKWLVQNGPISIAINANAMQFYVGGVSHPWKALCNPKSLDHGVLIVGYGVHKYSLFNKTLPYWIVKNSWSPSWGEQGYYRVYRGDGTCGLNQTPSSAIVA